MMAISEDTTKVQFPVYVLGNMYNRLFPWNIDLLHNVFLYD